MSTPDNLSLRFTAVRGAATYYVVHDPGDCPLIAGMRLEGVDVKEMLYRCSFYPGTVLRNAKNNHFRVRQNRKHQELVRL